jgi:hypothetical protein
MANTLQIKLLIGILAVLGVIAGIMVRHDRADQISRQAQTIEIDRTTQRKTQRMVQPPRAYLVP